MSVKQCVPFLPSRGSKSRWGLLGKPFWGSHLQKIGQKLKSYLYKDIYSSVIHRDENLEIAQMLNKRGLVKQILFHQSDEILLCY